LNQFLTPSDFFLVSKLEEMTWREKIFNKCYCRKSRKRLFFRFAKKRIFSDGTNGLERRWTKLYWVEGRLRWKIKLILLEKMCFSLLDRKPRTHTITACRLENANDSDVAGGVFLPVIGSFNRVERHFGESRLFASPTTNRQNEHKFRAFSRSR